MAQQVLTKVFTSADGIIEFKTEDGTTVVSMKCATGATAEFKGSEEFFGQQSDWIPIDDSSPVNIGKQTGFEVVYLNVLSGNVYVIAY